MQSYNPGSLETHLKLTLHRVESIDEACKRLQGRAAYLASLLEDRAVSATHELPVNIAGLYETHRDAAESLATIRRSLLDTMDFILKHPSVK